MGCLIAIISEYLLTTVIVSARDSPFDVDELFAFEKPRTLPPKLCIADSKLNLVLVLGSKNSVAKILPLHASLYLALLLIISLETSISSSISFFEKSSIPIKSLIFPPFFWPQLKDRAYCFKLTCPILCYLFAILSNFHRLDYF